MNKLLPSLHMQSSYSLLESTITIDSAISFAKKNNFEYLVLTDRNNMYGVAEFVKKTELNGIKPIIGIDLDVEDYQLILIARNQLGYKHLMELSSNKMQNKNIKLKDINPTNIYIIDHPVFGHYIKKGDELYIENYFVNNNGPRGVQINAANCLTKNSGIDILNFIRNDKKEIEEYQYNAKLLTNEPNVIQIQKILESSYFKFQKSKVDMKFTNEEEPANKKLQRLIMENGREILSKVKNLDLYKERIKYEFSVITKQNFADYFNIIFDIVNWSKQQDILIGPGRGSASGSLITYLLNITEIDPIKHDLLFERFLNPDRITLPDIDIDIQDNRRQDVIDYVFRKYGKDNVALISTFQKFGPKQAIRDAGRFLKMPLRDVDTIAKYYPSNSKFENAIKESPPFAALIKKNEVNKNLFKQAYKLNGLPRQLGTHAAGIVVSKEKINLKVPTTISSEGKNQTQYSMDYLEENGLIKFDLLGLKNLTFLKSILSRLKQINIQNIDLNDYKTLELLSSGQTNGIFQLESVGMKNTLRKIVINKFDDLVASISLFRPGPKIFIDDYVNVKNGNTNFDSIDDVYDSIVKETNGIIIYQEQIMLITQRYAGLSYGQADIMRRAISKKNEKNLQSIKDAFIKGAIKNNHNLEVASKIFEKIERFSNYGFNKSHAVSYSLLAYRLAYLKAHYKNYFFAEQINTALSESKKLEQIIVEARQNQIEIHAPKIEFSNYYVIVKENKILLPFGCIKGINKNVIEAVLDVRSKGFKDFAEIIFKLRKKDITEEQIALLIEAGTMRSFGNIQTLLAALPSFLRFITIVEKSGGNYSLYENLKPLINKIDENINVEMAMEKKIFGFVLDSFITKEFELETKIVDVKVGEPKETVFLIEKHFESKDKNGNTYCQYYISDSTISTKLLVFKDVYKFVKLTKPNTIVKGVIKASEFKGKKTYNLIEPWKVIKNA